MNIESHIRCYLISHLRKSLANLKFHLWNLEIYEYYLTRFINVKFNKWPLMRDPLHILNFSQNHIAPLAAFGMSLLGELACGSSSTSLFNTHV